MDRSNRLVPTRRIAATAAAAFGSLILPIVVIFGSLAGPAVSPCAAGAPRTVIGEDFGHEL